MKILSIKNNKDLNDVINFLGNGKRSRLAVLEQFFQEADFPARVLFTTLRQHRPLRDDKLGFVVCCVCQACGRAKVGFPLLRSALHAVLQVHALLVVVCDERTPRASAARCFAWRQGTSKRKENIRKRFSSSGIAKIQGALHTGVFVLVLLPQPLNADLRAHLRAGTSLRLT